MRKKRKLERRPPNPDTLDLNLRQVAKRNFITLSPRLFLPTDDYDMDLVKAQWWADKEYGERFAR